MLLQIICQTFRWRLKQLLKNIWLLFSGHLFLDKSRYCSIPQNKYNIFLSFFIVFLYSVVVCVIDIFCLSSLDFLSYVNLFNGMFYSLLYFCHREVLTFWTAERLLKKFYFLLLISRYSMCLFCFPVFLKWVIVSCMNIRRFNSNNFLFNTFILSKFR